MARAGLGGGMGRLGARGRVGGVAAGGAALLVGEANGFAADFIYATDASRVAVKTVGTVVSSGTSFFTSSGTSSKWVYNATGTLVNIPVGTLPIDYDPVTHAARGLLVEPAATNLLLRSQEFDSASWSLSNLTVAANATTAPDGTATADKLNEDTGTATHNNHQAISTTTGVFSVYAKQAERPAIMLYDLTAAKGHGFNLSTGATFVVGGITTTGGAVIQSVGNGWYRCSIPLVSTAGVRVYLHNGTSYSYTGTAGFGVYVWGGQVETGTVATSPIPTTSATVTRGADSVRITPAQINYSATVGSWWVELDRMVGSASTWIIGYTTATYAPLYTGSPTAFGLYDGAALDKTVPSSLGSHKVACAFASADRAITADGLAPATSATAGIALGTPGANIALGADPNGPGLTMNGYIRKVRYLPRRPSNAELQTMTI